MSKWLTWEPHEPQRPVDSGGIEPAKPPETNFAGFAGATPGENRIIRTTKLCSAEASETCPYLLPEGINLVRYRQKAAPVAVTVCSVVNDVEKFIKLKLVELDARLRHPVQIKAGDSVFELLSKLGDCGLELRLEWPPIGTASEISPVPAESEPAKPAKAPGRDERDARR